MKTELFDYNLPKRFIAQHPLTPRDSSRLMVYDTSSDVVLHRRFADLGEFLNSGDLLVLNRSRVIPARLKFDGREIFLLKDLGDHIWQAMVRPGKHFGEGFKFIENGLEGEVLSVFEDGTRKIRFSSDPLEVGSVPLPPYIKSGMADFSKYQTVYALESGSVAAPTAGLHFTKRLIRELVGKRIELAQIVLHVGRGTFLPVSTDDIEDHKMHCEFYEIPKPASMKLNSALREHRRIVAVGTTSVRVLESAFKDGFTSCSGETDIFIYPRNYKWKVVDLLITNFHLPKSTLIMLVASFLEHKGVRNPTKKIRALYRLAMDKGYRFYSFGDAMLII